MTEENSINLSERDSRRISESLLEKGVISSEQLDQARQLQEERKSNLIQELVRMKALTDDQLNAAVAEQFGLEVYGADKEILSDKKLIEKVPYAFSRKHTVLPLTVEQGDDGTERAIVAVSDPLHLEPLDDLRIMLELPIRAVFCPVDQLKTGIHNCYEQKKGAASQLIAGLRGKKEQDETGQDGESEYDLFDTKKEQAPIVKLLNLILTEAIQQGASDVHFDPEAEGMRVRYRIDGVLLDRHAPSIKYQAQLTTRIKVMAKLDIAERRLPQDGRIKLRMGQREVDFRVSTVPTSNGERIVLRILDKGSIVLGLDHLGMPDSIDKKFQDMINLSEGIILVTGPTGSGKTTTLYSAISEIQSDEMNIMTVEDPIEYKLPGIAQIGIQSKIGLTFAAGLRHILRQDPDVILVGEIRDQETANIAVQASLTGHLVMSTLHTNDAPSAVTRLVDMGVESYLLSSTLVGVLAQRLVRCLCQHCKEAYKPLHQECIDLEINELEKGEVFYRAKGCDHCYQSGYSGRRGIYELMMINSEIQRQIVKSPDAVAIRKVALDQGMRSLRHHGAMLVKEGITTVAEVLRVTRGAS